MIVLVLNSGSSSIKFQLIEVDSESVITKGAITDIGSSNSSIWFLKEGKKVVDVSPLYDHQMGIKFLFDKLTDPAQGVLKDLNEIDAVGHRVVHGGEFFKEAVFITDEVIEDIKECITLAPLHNPPNLKGILAVRNILPDIPQVAVFDTAFHQTMEREQFLYAIPRVFYNKYKIRRYGFHGMSHYYVSREAANFLKKDIDSINLITCHLGNGASITAIKNGKSFDTSMGFTPLEGLIMGTRSGDLDPAIILFIMQKEELGLSEANTLLNKHSGLLGVSGISNDVKLLIERMEEGDKYAKLALDMFAYRIKKYIGAYLASLNGAEAIVFTGGIGENSPYVRELVLNNMEFLGIELDPIKNEEIKGGVSGEITKDTSRVKALVIPTNEELVIARETKKVVEAMRNDKG